MPNEQARRSRWRVRALDRAFRGVRRLFRRLAAVRGAGQASDAHHTRAENGNVAMTGEIDLRRGWRYVRPRSGFGPNAMEAGQHAVISLMDDFDRHQELSSSASGRPGTTRWRRRASNDATPRALRLERVDPTHPRIEDVSKAA